MSDDKPDIEEELLSVWQRLSLKQLRWTLVALITVIAAAFGGLQTAHHVTPASFGQAYNDGPLRITPHSVLITDQRAGLVALSSQCRYLVLNATIQSTANDSVPFPLPGILTGNPGDCAPHPVDSGKPRPGLPPQADRRSQNREHRTSRANLSRGVGCQPMVRAGRRTGVCCWATASAGGAWREAMNKPALQRIQPAATPRASDPSARDTRRRP